MRTSFGIGRLLLAAVQVAALVGNFDYVLGFATFATGNFFSYFTIQSAIAAVVMFVVGAVLALRTQEDPPWFDLFRSLVTTYIIVSGIVFALMVIQSNTRDYRIDVPWSDQVLHFWVPAFALLDWLFDPHKARVSVRILRWVALYPLVWGVFTLVRGASVGWYPYFFLDSAQVTPLEMLLYCAICLLIIVGITATLAATTRVHLSPWWERREPGRGR
ncbi:Pr6Pr family membrane protein [Glaciibacter superstes]|uniref:Pr6Pr family membrane protein n=1 Tax=Glaciibacter superstes TaxID=501023 RepID=UPI0012FC5BA3|nr:Pr6Pr family membrane protein [Glaciibacter superstes]